MAVAAVAAAVVELVNRHTVTVNVVGHHDAGVEGALDVADLEIEHAVNKEIQQAYRLVADNIPEEAVPRQQPAGLALAFASGQPVFSAQRLPTPERCEYNLKDDTEKT